MGEARVEGGERLEGHYDVLICGASFAGLAAARELAGSGADVLVVDRYEIGERATSACGIPTEWLRQLGLLELELQRFGELVVHTPGGTTVLDLPYTFSTFNYDAVCEQLWRDCDATFETATVERRRPRVPSANGHGPEEGGDIAVETDRGTVSAPLVIDALGWRRLLAPGGGFQPLDAPLTRALEVHPQGTSADLLAADLGRERVRYQGNWIPHELRSPTEGDVFFAGDSAGQCLPLTAEGIRTALYYGIAAGRELRSVLEGRQSRDEAIASYARLHDSHKFGFGMLLWVQRLIPRVPPRLLAPGFRIFKTRMLLNLAFNSYLKIAPPEFAAQPEMIPQGGGARAVPETSSA
jgi:flavin-dependent dehydrogenase